MPDLAADLVAAVERYGTTTALLGAELSQPAAALVNASRVPEYGGPHGRGLALAPRGGGGAKALPSATGADVPFYEGKIATAATLQAPSSKYAGAGGPLASLEHVGARRPAGALLALLTVVVLTLFRARCLLS